MDLAGWPAPDPLRIVNGEIALPDRAGLGIEIDEERMAAAHHLYKEQKLGERDDTAAMQYLIRGWSFAPKRPCLLRSCDPSFPSLYRPPLPRR